jgi:hypothetical protein
VEEDGDLWRLELVQMGVKYLALGAVAGLASLVAVGAGASSPDRHATAAIRSGSIVFGSNRSTPRNEEIYVMHSDGSGERPLTSSPGHDEAGSEHERNSASCRPTFSGGAMHLCGPATAQLSVFPGFTFRNGNCKRLTVAGSPQFVLELGKLKPGSRTNGGLSYFKIEIDGPLSHPTSGSVISWHKGKRWAGLGDSFKGTAHGGIFAVTGAPANGGRRATGSFRC